MRYDLTSCVMTSYSFFHLKVKDEMSLMLGYGLILRCWGPDLVITDQISRTGSEKNII